MLEKLIYLVCLAGTAVVFADVLVRPGMLLEPVSRWAWDAYRARTGLELGEQWWAKPLWLCYKCVAGQWGFWGFLVRYYPGYTWRTVPEHLAFTAFTIIAAIILHKWTTEN